MIRIPDDAPTEIIVAPIPQQSEPVQVSRAPLNMVSGASLVQTANEVLEICREACPPPVDPAKLFDRTEGFIKDLMAKVERGLKRCLQRPHNLA